MKVLTDIDALLASTSRARDETTEELRLGIFPSLATYALPRLLGASRWASLGIALIFQVGQAALA